MNSNDSLLNSIIESTEDGILVVTLSGEVLKTNKRFEQMWNIPQQLIDEKNDQKLLQYILDQLADREEFLNKVQDLYTHPESESHDTFKFKDGRIFERVSIPQKSGDQIIGRVWNFRDITTHVLTEESRNKSEQIYKAIFENSSDGMFLMSDVYIDCNKSSCELFGCPKELIIGQSPAMFSPEYQPDGRYSKALAKEKLEMAYRGIPQRFYWQHKRKDNTLFDVSVSLSSVLINGDRINHAVIRDITDQKKAEKIRDTIFNIAEAAFTSSDMTMLYQHIHAAVSELMVTKNFYIAIFDQKRDVIMFPYIVDEYDQPVERKKHLKGRTEYVLRTGKPCLINKLKYNELNATGELELKGKLSAIWLGVPLKVAGKIIGVIVVQDYENEKAYGDDELQLLVFVSEQVAQAIERKKNAEAISAYAEELKQLNLTKDKFFSIIAHDLRGPFNTTLNLSQILIDEVESLSRQDIKEFTTEIYKALKGQFKLLENLLSWSRLQLGRMEFIKKRIILKELTDEIVEIVSGSSKQKQITVINEVEMSFEIIADINMLRSILYNLIANAIKFTQSGGQITIHSQMINDYAHITVSDTGVGIEKDLADRLYRIDSQQTTVGTNGEKGTGLGLILVKEMVEKHKGEIMLNSIPGKGSEFTFTIPFENLN